jgi:tRNA(Ile)-lysidine synthase
MALLHVLSLLRGKLGFALHAHGVDHGLRADAARELDQAAELAKSLDVPWGQTLTKVAPGGNLQARARTQRFAALRAAASEAGASTIATAHHADDRAETVLIRLLRGTSPYGLGVLPARSGDLVRPFLRARRSDILAHIARHQVPYSSDPSNANPRFVRTRVRHELLPLMEQLSPSIVSHLCRLADDLHGDRDREGAGLVRQARSPSPHWRGADVASRKG